MTLALILDCQRAIADYTARITVLEIKKRFWENDLLAKAGITRFAESVNLDAWHGLAGGIK